MIPNAVEDVPPNELFVFWSPLQLPGGHSDILGIPMVALSTEEETKPAEVLEFGKLPAEVRSEKRVVGSISGDDLKRQ